MPKPPYVLIQNHVSTDTVEALQQLLEQARAGEVIGVAFVAMLKRRGYIADAAGEAYRNPTFTRGMIRALDDRLAQRVEGDGKGNGNGHKAAHKS
jgi:hypothetical protein